MLHRVWSSVFEVAVRKAGHANAGCRLATPAFVLLCNPVRDFGGGGENCTPDYLLCGQMPCCLGYAALKGTYEVCSPRSS